ncbi:PfkB family carbohydrate kinase [Ferrimonas marina]|uniref:Site-specific DNA-methyltransferase (Adenine-specific) n=1 Tax=Ferrimonas marina TaxID=299255 RepID=A0A1M5XRL8_9GAMM|nr:PfkB family carbohydrate kinase [Ferrimonas marina]SHI02467.1 site-specific DNA-methyltransferase (adenine-specific) [Ferrimonas marina]
MAQVLVIANINCDHILRLNRPLQTGARIHYEEQGFRLGGGGANTSLGLIWAGHKVQLLSQVGEDERGDWLLEQASRQGIDCSLVHRHVGPTQALKLLMDPSGERTILRPNRPRLMLPPALDTQGFDAIYVNLSAEGLAPMMAQAMDQGALLISQLPKDLGRRPCHYLITSADDLTPHKVEDPWSFALSIAGPQLKGVIVTDGDKGATLFNAEGQQHCPACEAELVDSTGAGDCYAAGLLNGLVKGHSEVEAMADAARWAAYAVSAASSVPPDSLRRHLHRG